jgi:ubiquinone/menaquinone biosynthesis C-methylase UbiE
MPQDPEITAYYASFAEEDRLDAGPSRLERARTTEIVARHLPAAPARVLDVGGAGGTYARWLASLGHDVHLADLSERLVGVARDRDATAARRVTSLVVGDARALPYDDACADVVLLLGPLYHLTRAEDRAMALAEARRVLRPTGVAIAAAISRHASALDGMARRLTIDPRFRAIRDRDLIDGQHRNDTGRGDYFTTAYFHRPRDLRAELGAAGFDDVEVLAVEGPCWLLADFDERWEDDALREDLLDTARRLEREEELLGASAHLLGIGRAPAASSSDTVPTR